jgi:hypothetical protein
LSQLRSGPFRLRPVVGQCEAELQYLRCKGCIGCDPSSSPRSPISVGPTSRCYVTRSLSH